MLCFVNNANSIECNFLYCMYMNNQRDIAIDHLQTHITKNAVLEGWTVKLINKNQVELTKNINTMSYFEKYDNQTFQQMFYDLINK